MTHYDVCNGDADGLCALQQLRLAQPLDCTLVTGRKREIALLERVAAVAGDSVTVLDVSLDVNRAALARLLAMGVAVTYYDHHHAGHVPRHPNLTAHVDTRPGLCTSFIVDRELRGAYRRWALVGAYGDGLVEEADRMAADLGLAADVRRALHDLGTDLNYNAYGDSDADLVVHPSRLRALLEGQADPLALGGDATLASIRGARIGDLALARTQPVEAVGPHALACTLPDAGWCRRIRGTLAHDLARRHREHACAVLSTDAAGDYVVSVRAPLVLREGADALCRRFPTGGGRAAAAGIDHLPRTRLDEFLAAFAAAFP